MNGFFGNAVKGTQGIAFKKAILNISFEIRKEIQLFFSS